MSATMGTFFSWLVRASWQAAVLVVIVFAVQLVFRKKLAARWRYALWLLVVARLVLPVSLQSPLSLFNYAPVKNTHAQPVAAIVQPETLLASQRAEVAEPSVASEPAAVSTVSLTRAPEVYKASRPVAASTPAARPVEQARAPFLRENFGFIGAMIWALGAGLLALRVVAQSFAFVRRLRGAQVVTETKTIVLFEQCKASLGIGFPIRLVETDEVKSPALHGFFRPCLLLPTQMIGGFSQKELRYIFLHELAHVKRRDMAAHWAATLLGILHWFNPVLWLGFRRMAADRELACDELALSHAGEQESKPYGEAIIKVLEVCAYSPSLPGVMGILENRNQMRERIAMILTFKRRSQRSLLALVLLAAIAVVTLTDARSGPTTTETPATGTNSISATNLEIYRDLITTSEARCAKEEKILEQLEGLAGEKLKVTLVKVYPDQILDQMMKDEAATEEQLRKLKEDSSARPEDVARTKKLLREYKIQIDSRVSGIIEGIKISVKSLKAQSESARAVIEKNRPNLTGHVQTKDGTPLAATVFISTAGPRVGSSTFCPSCYADCRKRATSDAKGDFKIESLDPQLIFRVLVVATGYEPKFVGKVDPAKEPIRVELKPSDAANAAPERSLHGRVVDVKGDPIEGAVVNSYGIRTADGGGSWGELPGVDPLAVTDAKGEFLITSREPFDSMDVKVEARAFADKMFTKQASGTKKHDLVMTEGAALTGRVMFNGQPLKNVSVGIVSVDRRMEKFVGNFEIGTDAEGRFAFVNVPPNVDFYIYGMMQTLKRYGATGITEIHSGNDGATTAVGDLAVGPAYRLAGRVVLSDGKPVPPKTRLLVDRDEAWDSMEVTLDKNGNFDATGIPAGGLTLGARVSGYRVSAKNISLDRMNPYMLAGRVEGDITNLVFLLEKGKDLEPDYSQHSLNSDQARNHTLHGVETVPGYDPHANEWALSGRVIDGETQAAIAHFRVIPGNADITWGQTHWDRLGGVEGTNGNYKIYFDKHLGQPMLQVQADGYLPASVSLTPMQTGAANVALKKGVGLRGTVLLPDGKPAADAGVLLICRDDDNFSLDSKGELDANHNRARLKKTDAAGHFSFAPELGMLSIAAASTEGFAQVPVESLKTNPTITLGAYGRIKGTLKRSSGPGKKEDLDVEFVTEDIPVMQRITLQHHAVTDEQGGFDFKGVPPGRLVISYRVMNEGQQMTSWENEPLERVTLKPGETLELNINAPNRVAPEKINVQFVPVPEPVRVAGAGLKGRVLLPDGKPAADAQVALQVEQKYLALGKAAFSRSGAPEDKDLIVQTGPNGEFTLPMYDQAKAVMALNDTGFGMRSLEEFQASPQITLQAWGRIEGTLHVGKKLGTNQVVIVSKRRFGRGGFFYEPEAFQARTDEQGHFVITYVPPGEQSLARQVPEGNGSTSQQPVGDIVVKAGGVTTVDVGGTGETVIGKVKLKDAAKIVDWKNVMGAIHTSYPKTIGKMATFKTAEERLAYQRTDEYLALQKIAWENFHSYPAIFSADGSFVAEEVLPGKYVLDLQQLDPNSPQPVMSRIPIGHQEIVVAAADKGSDAPVDLGVVEVAPVIKPPKQAKR